jgi:hypothetical protein
MTQKLKGIETFKETTGSLKYLNSGIWVPCLLRSKCSKIMQAENCLFFKIGEREK